jgi:hypothetical protein
MLGRWATMSASYNKAFDFSRGLFTIPGHSISARINGNGLEESFLSQQPKTIKMQNLLAIVNLIEHH